MNPLSALRQGLGWRLFLSHLIVVMVGSSVLAVVAYLHAPGALSSHVSQMQAMMQMDHALVADLRAQFVAAVSEVLLVAGAVAVLAAIVASSFVAWRIIAPIKSLTDATRRIANGHYHERVETVWKDELGELANSFNRMAKSLDETEQQRMELIGNLAHELKTPLASIRSMMEGLVDGVLPAAEETFLDVQREASRLQRLTDELSQLSRADAGEIQLRFEKTDPAELARQAASRLRPQFLGKDVVLRLELPDHPPTVLLDSERITQVLINLLGNALQYTDPGGTVVLRCTIGGERLVYLVWDTGIGIPHEELPRVFDRFYRVDKSRARSRGGSGIGLTIAAHLVRAHGGEIRAESKGAGFGSTFTVLLPAVTEP